MNNLREKRIQKIRDVEDVEAEMRRIEARMSEADKILITNSSSSARNSRKGHKDRTTFDTDATMQLQAQRLDSLKDELRDIEQEIRDFEELVSGG